MPARRMRLVQTANVGRVHHDNINQPTYVCDTRMRLLASDSPRASAQSQYEPRVLTSSCCCAAPACHEVGKCVSMHVDACWAATEARRSDTPWTWWRPYIALMLRAVSNDVQWL
eukprot:6176035-Pleurochrysis_carterae.AAC.3